MTPLQAGIDGREKGAIPVSVGTSLAIEGACGVYPDRPQSPAPIEGVKEIWFNLRTLIRNITGALPADIKNQLLPEHVYPVLMEEIAIIEAAIIKASMGNCRSVFYYCNYSSLKRKFPKALFKELSTHKQKFAQAVEDNVLREIAKQQDYSQDIRYFQYELTGAHPISMILSHLPVDLLSRYNFVKLELLESHTGLIKSYPQWYTKLTNGKELHHIPFGPFSLQVFGDNGNHFSPLPIAVRNEVLRLAEEDRWTSVTTSEKIRVSLKKIKDDSMRTLLLSML